MTSQRTLDVSRLGDLGLMKRSPLFWGGAVIWTIEGTMFALCIASYFYARMSMDVWPPPGVQFPRIELPTAELILLIASCYPMYRASEANKRNDLSKMRLYMMVNFLLAAVAVVLRIIAWNTLNFNWESDIHGSLVWGILTLHTFDLGADLAMTIVLVVLAFTPRWNDTYRPGADWDAITWYFLVAIWIPLYFTIYVAPHLVRT